MSVVPVGLASWSGTTGWALRVGLGGPFTGLLRFDGCTGKESENRLGLVVAGLESVVEDMDDMARP